MQNGLHINPTQKILSIMVTVGVGLTVIAFLRVLHTGIEQVGHHRCSGFNFFFIEKLNQKLFTIILLDWLITFEKIK